MKPIYIFVFAVSILAITPVAIGQSVSTSRSAVPSKVTLSEAEALKLESLLLGNERLLTTNEEHQQTCEEQCAASHPHFWEVVERYICRGVCYEAEAIRRKIDNFF